MLAEIAGVASARPASWEQSQLAELLRHSLLTHHGEAVARRHLRRRVEGVVDHRRSIQGQCGVAAKGQAALRVQSRRGRRLQRGDISGASQASCRTRRGCCWWSSAMGGAQL